MRRMRAWFPCVLHLPDWEPYTDGSVQPLQPSARPAPLGVPAATANSSPRFAPLCARVASQMRERRALSYAEHACPVRRVVHACSRARRRLARSVIIRAPLFSHLSRVTPSLSLSPPFPPFLSHFSANVPFFVVSKASLCLGTFRDFAPAILSRFLANVPSRISAICFLRVACFVSSALRVLIELRTFQRRNG